MAAKQICALLLIGVVCAMATTIKPDHEHKPAVLTLTGPCPEFPAFESLESAKLSGDWFMVYYAKVGIEKDTAATEPKRCLKKTLAFTPEGSLTATMSFMKGDKQDTHSSTGTPVAGKPGKFSLTMAEFPGKTGFMTILDTDYTNYAVCLVCCQGDGDKHGYMVNVVSRQKTLDAPLLEKAKTVITGAKIIADLIAIDQTC